jgi:integrase
MVVGELILEYFEYAKGYFCRDGKPTSEVAVIRSALKVLGELHAHTPCSEFGPLALAEVQQAMIARGWSRKTINRQVGRIRKAFKWAVSRQILDVTVYQALLSVPPLQAGRCQAKERPPVAPVDDETIKITLDNMQSTIASDAIRLLRVTGARPSEILSMRLEDVDKTDPTCWRYTVTAHKTQHHGRSRVIHIGPRGIAILAPRILKAGKGPIFPMDRTSLRRAVDRACKRAGVEPWSPYRLRHKMASQVRAEYGLEASQCILGHSHADVTHVYAERDMRQAATVARLIG